MKGGHRVPFRVFVLGGWRAEGSATPLSSHHDNLSDCDYTLQQINMEPENHPTKKGKSSSKPPLVGSKCSFSRYMQIVLSKSIIYLRYSTTFLLVEYDFSVSWTLFIWATHPIQTVLGSKSFCYVTLMYLAGPTAVTFLVAQIILVVDPQHPGSFPSEMTSLPLFQRLCWNALFFSPRFSGE